MPFDLPFEYLTGLAGWLAVGAAGVAALLKTRRREPRSRRPAHFRKATAAGSSLSIFLMVLTIVGPCFAPAGESPVRPDSFETELRRRDQETGEVRFSKERLECRRVGIVVVDIWNWHWCKTATQRVAALVPRMNRTLDVARELGMTVMLCPSDVVDRYVGWPQREAALATPRHAVPPLAQINCPPPPDGGGCGCGHDRCRGNYGWDSMHPDLRIDAADLMPDTLDEVYSICRERQLTHLIYMGVHTQVCLLGKPMGLRNLKAAGMSCILARDLTDAHPGYDPATGFTPDSHTTEVVAHFERYLAPSMHLSDELVRLGGRDRNEVVDPVRVTPWGTADRPHLFKDEITVTLSAPLEPAAQIHYTLDGSSPSSASPRYEKPFRLAASTRVRAVACENDRFVCLASDARFVRLPPLPPLPDVFLSDLSIVGWVGSGHTAGGAVRLDARSRPPQKDRSNEALPLVLRGVEYPRGVGVHAPNKLVYALQPEYDRFVALTGVDEHILEASNGSNLARYPSVEFKVFVDGRELASSPVMRIAEQPWRFDVKLPEGGRQLSLVATDGGDGNREDLANWVQAGFVRH